MPHRNEYSPSKNPNFFTQNGHVQSGYKASIIIRGALRGENLQTLFGGEIVELTHEVENDGYRVIATDNSSKLREDEITDFGIRKNNNLRETPDRSSIRGEFEFSEPVIPVSRESITSTISGTVDNPSSMGMVRVDNFSDEGQLDEKNFQLSDDATSLLTETAPRKNPMASNIIVNATYKAPLRGIGIARIVRELLSEHSITSPNILFPPMTHDDIHWSHFARPGYEIESATGTNNVAFGWNGYVTDYVRKPDGSGKGDMYFLYSHQHRNINPQLIKYTAESDTWVSVFQSAVAAEWWQLATADFSEFFILQTTGTYERGVPRLATYNPAETGTASTSILKVTVANNAQGVPQGTPDPDLFATTHRPQMAVHYWYGFVSGTGRQRINNSRFGFLPDTRTGFYVAGNAVWYRYASSANFGLARTKINDHNINDIEITIPKDEFQNEASFDFTIDNGVIYAAHTTIGDTSGTLKSRFLVYKKDMPADYTL